MVNELMITSNIAKIVAGTMIAIDAVIRPMNTVTGIARAIIDRIQMPVDVARYRPI